MIVVSLVCFLYYTVAISDFLSKVHDKLCCFLWYLGIICDTYRGMSEAEKVMVGFSNYTRRVQPSICLTLRALYTSSH